MTILRFPLLFDGAYGTLYASRTKNPAHQADEAVLNEPDTVRGMHEDYIHAGAQAIKTDTFALPVLLKQDPAKAGQILKQAIRLATEAARNHPDVLIFADLGPVHPGDDAIEIYEAIALRVGKSFITECWWKILPSVASLAVWGVHRFRMATRV